VILPLAAPLGTVAVIDVAVEAVIVAAVPLNLTVGEEKFDPLIVTLDPTAPELGLNPLIVGPVPPPPADAMNLMLSRRLLPLEVVAPEKVTRTKALAAVSRPVTVGNESTPVLANESRIVPAVVPPEIVVIGDHAVPLLLYSHTWDENPVPVLWAANVI
jgi:hypothetical protein